MAIPGYDPEDLDEFLEARLERREIQAFLTEAEAERWRDGEPLIELLDGTDIQRLLDRAEGEASAN